MINTSLRGAFILLCSLVFVGCAIKSPAPEDAQVDRALKACNLGYVKSEEVRLAFVSAYKYADKNYSLDFNASMTEALNTNVMTFASNTKDNNNSKEIINLIKDTQGCVIQMLYANKPLTQSELLKQCKDSLQDRLSSDAVVKSYFHVLDHPKNSDTILVMSALIEYTPDSHYILIKGNQEYLCFIKNNRFDDVVNLGNSNW